MTVLRPGHGPAAPVRSAARHRLGTRLDALDPRVRRDVVRLLTLLALLPSSCCWPAAPSACRTPSTRSRSTAWRSWPAPSASSTSPTAATTTRPYARCAAARATPRPFPPCPRGPG